MRLIQDIKWMAAACLLVASVIIPGVGLVTGAGDQDWLDAMTQAVLAEQAREEGAGSPFVPYVTQLAAVRAQLAQNDGEGVYHSMNRFMDMLQAREEGIAAEAAERLFDYCYRVTPARYHDVSRHLHRMSGFVVGAPSV